MITQKYNSGRFHYSSQEGNPNYSKLSNADFQYDKFSNLQNDQLPAGSHHQNRKLKSIISKGYYKSTSDNQELKNSSKSKKRKTSKKNRQHKNNEITHTPLSRTKILKNQNLNEFTSEFDSVSKKKRRKTQGSEAIKHQKNISDNSILYTSQSCGGNGKEKSDSRGKKQQRVAMKATYSPYVTSNGNNKNSHRSKSTNPNISNNAHKKLNCFEGFVNIDLSQLPHDMTQREVMETMIRKHELSNVMYSDEDEDTSRYTGLNIDDRRTCRRSQYNKNNDVLSTGNKSNSSKERGNIFIAKESNSPIDLNKKVILASKSSAVQAKNNETETEGDISFHRKKSIESSLITEETINKIMVKMDEDLECLQSCDKSRETKITKINEEKKFFVY